VAQANIAKAIRPIVCAKFSECSAGVGFLQKGFKASHGNAAGPSETLHARKLFAPRSIRASSSRCFNVSFSVAARRHLDANSHEKYFFSFSLSAEPKAQK